MSGYFDVNVCQYVQNKSFSVYRPASLNMPKEHSVMFVTEPFMKQTKKLEHVRNCLIFWPIGFEVPSLLYELHAIVLCANPRLEYCSFFRDNDISNHPKRIEYQQIGGAFIGKKAVIGNSTVIFPNAYIDDEVIIGNNTVIGFGACLIGRVSIGNDVVIREYAVIGADGLSTDRDLNGEVVPMPQFGGVSIGSRVYIGTHTIIARGAIDDTLIKDGSRIDNSCFISHNVNIGKDTIIVGETIMFGSSSTGEQAYISGNCTIRNGIHIGENATIGMGAVVMRSVPNKTTVFGNPANNR